MCTRSVNELNPFAKLMERIKIKLGVNFKYKIKFEDASPLTTVPFQDLQVQGLDFTKRDLGD